jgi:hypothetical protein
MKPEKAAKPRSATQISDRSAANPLTPEASMHTDAQLRKAAGRLSREDQRRLGDILQRVYDDIIRQGVPDRFKNLLNELGESKQKAEKEQKSAADDDGERGNGCSADRFVEAKGLDRPNKGSH